MDEKLFKLIEIIFVGGALIVVIYLGGFFGPVESLAATSTPPTSNLPPANQTYAAEVGTQITVEQTLRATITPWVLPSKTPKPSTSIATPAIRLLEYKVVAGDTCLAIASQFDITLDDLMILNDLNGDCLILEGSTLIIPLPVNSP